MSRKKQYERPKYRTKETTSPVDRTCRERRMITKAQLIQELSTLRQRVIELEVSETEHNRAEKAWFMTSLKASA
jgi:hypothetical protein